MPASAISVADLDFIHKDGPLGLQTSRRFIVPALPISCWRISEFSAGTTLLHHLLIIISLPVMAHNTLIRPCSGSLSALSSTTLRRVQLRTCPSQPKTNVTSVRRLASVSSIPVDGIDNLVPLPGQSALRFGYEAHYASKLEQMKREKSYRYFRNVNRLAKQFPLAHSPEGKTVSVWCTNDYVSLSLAPYLRSISGDWQNP